MRGRSDMKVQCNLRNKADLADLMFSPWLEMLIQTVDSGQSALYSLYSVSGGFAIVSEADCSGLINSFVQPPPQLLISLCLLIKTQSASPLAVMYGSLTKMNEVQPRAYESTPQKNINVKTKLP